MRIKETANFEAFEVVDEGGEVFAFVYNQHEIGFDVEQAAQLIDVLQHIIDTGEVPE